MLSSISQRNRSASPGANRSVSVITLQNASLVVAALVAEVVTRGDWRSHVRNLHAAATLARTRKQFAMAEALAAAADAMEARGEDLTAAFPPVKAVPVVPAGDPFPWEVDATAEVR